MALFALICEHTTTADHSVDLEISSFGKRLRHTLGLIPTNTAAKTLKLTTDFFSYKDALLMCTNYTPLKES
jgi:hypothetical protein